LQAEHLGALRMRTRECLFPQVPRGSWTPDYFTFRFDYPLPISCRRKYINLMALGCLRSDLEKRLIVAPAESALRCSKRCAEPRTRDYLLCAALCTCCLHAPRYSNIKHALQYYEAERKEQAHTYIHVSHSAPVGPARSGVPAAMALTYEGLTAVSSLLSTNTMVIGFCSSQAGQSIVSISSRRAERLDLGSGRT
jgi:hypothetical protein